MENQKKDSKTWGDRQKIELVCRPMDPKKKKNSQCQSKPYKGVCAIILTCSL